jgi:hypothetical protein
MSRVVRRCWPSITCAVQNVWSYNTHACLQINHDHITHAKLMSRVVRRCWPSGTCAVQNVWSYNTCILTYQSWPHHTRQIDEQSGQTLLAIDHLHSAKCMVIRHTCMLAYQSWPHHTRHIDEQSSQTLLAIDHPCSAKYMVIRHTCMLANQHDHITHAKLMIRAVRRCWPSATCAAQNVWT